MGVGDLRSQDEGIRQAITEEKERSEVEMRNEAYQSAYTKAEEATEMLQLVQTQKLAVNFEEKENHVISDDYDNLCASLGRATKIGLKKQEEQASGIEAITFLATSIPSSKPTDHQKNEN